MTNSASIHPTNGVLMVTRLDGPTVEIAKSLVDKAIYVETNGFWGRAYFDLRKPTEPGMELGEQWIQSAADISRLLGFETVVDETPSTFGRGFPMSHIAVYAGWYREHVDGPFLNEEVEFMPGALAYHLHSFSAATLRVTDKHWVAPLLDRGATVTLGCVHEPYLGGTPDIGVLVTRLYYMRFSFGEAAYASQPVNSWMTTVVGDPLFTPLLRPADQLHVELVERRDPLRVWSQLRLVNLNLAKGLPATQAVQYLESIPATGLSAVLSEKLGDLYAGLEKPSSALENWQAALALDPSPQQRIRLQLRLGEKLAEAERLEEAVTVYEQFTEENPRHPEVLRVYRELVRLSTRLGRETEAKRYEQEIQSRSGS
jgi:tetratricopeptide (TPR) repeat protein